MGKRTYFGLSYLVAMLIGAIVLVKLDILVAIILPIILSILATITDEGAQSGAMGFRGKEAWQRICVNVHWALFTFYLSAVRGIVVPEASSHVKDVALILALLSLVAGVSGGMIIRRFGRGGALMASLSLPIAITFATIVSGPICGRIRAC